MTSHRNTLLALALAALSATSFAQNTTPTTPDSNIGVSPSTGKEAMDKAIPRSDTATVTRTGESAADKAGRAADATADAVTPGANRDTGSATSGTSAGSTTGSGSTTGTTGSGNAAGTTGSGMGMGGGDTSSPTRAARADRG